MRAAHRVRRHAGAQRLRRPRRAAPHQGGANGIFLADLLRRSVPELGPDAERLAALVPLAVPALWDHHARPAGSVLAAYLADPQLAARHIDFAPAAEELLATYAFGLLARRAA